MESARKPGWNPPRSLVTRAFIPWRSTALSAGTGRKRARPPWRRLTGVALGLLAAGIGTWLARRGAHSKEIGSPSVAEARGPSAPSVDVVRPQRGGIPRTIAQPA